MATPSNQEKIILFYEFVPLADPEAIRLWQSTLCESLDLFGRIIISSKGINGTLGGNINKLKSYVRQTRTYAPFKETQIKWGSGKKSDFPKLSVKHREETVTLQATLDYEVDEAGVVDGGQYIKPQDLDAFVAANDDVVFFDGRNKYESDIGKFKDAVTPPINSFKDFEKELDKPEYEALKEKKIITYCTGGIRCEVLTPLMKAKGFKNVYQVHGGIVKYGEHAKDKGLWEGKCFVFDNRMSIAFSDSAKDIAECKECGKATSDCVNFPTKAHRDLVIMCKECQEKLKVNA
jgi:UPF0176 protein